MTTMNGDLWPLNECLAKLKTLSYSNHSNQKEIVEVYTAAIGLLCHLKQEHQILYSLEKKHAAFPPIKQLPATLAVISDPPIFQVLLKCLRAPPTGDEGTAPGSKASTTGAAKVHHHHHHNNLNSTNNSGGSLARKSRGMSIDELAKKSPKPGGAHKKLHSVSATDEVIHLPLHGVAATTLFMSFLPFNHWPATLVQAFAEDFFGPRLWVEQEECKAFADNLVLSLQTPEKGPPDQIEGHVKTFYSRLLKQPLPPPLEKSLSNSSISSKASALSAGRKQSKPSNHVGRAIIDTDSDSGEEELVEVSKGTVTSSEGKNSSAAAVRVNNDDDSSSSGEEEVVTSSRAVPIARKRENGGVFDFPSTVNLTRIRPRYFGVNRDAALDGIKMSLEERLNVKLKQNSRLLIQSLPPFCVVPGVRALVAQNLAKWLQSPALSGGARTLFSAVVQQLRNTDPPLKMDLQAIDAILDMEVKANQLNMHIENVTKIAERIPTRAVSRHLYSKLLRKELACIMKDTSPSTENMQMVCAVHGALAPPLANDGIASAILSLLLPSGNQEVVRSERNRLVESLRSLIRRLSSRLGSAFDGRGIVESLLSFGLNGKKKKWTTQEEEDRGRILVECITLLIPAPSFSNEVVLGRGKNQRKAATQEGLTNEEIKSIKKQLLAARKLLVTWACSDYGPLWSKEQEKLKATKSSRHRKENDATTLGAGLPDYSSIMDGARSNSLTQTSTCPDAIQCVLFLLDPESDQMQNFLFPEKRPAKNDAIHYRIKQCHLYGADVDDEMVKIILESAKLDNGISSSLAISLIEHLFKSCKAQRAQCGELILEDSNLVWQLYNLVEYVPKNVPNIAEKEEAKKDEMSDEDDKFADAEEDEDADFASDKVTEEKKPAIPRLAYPGLWWRATAVALVMCGASPKRIGEQLYGKHPTLNALVKMVTSGRYRFPTVDCDEENREIMKKGESELREEESRVAELLFLPPKPKETKPKRIERHQGPAGSRASARQRSRFERMMKERREKEAAEALVLSNRRKKMLKAAQKTIMLWDPKSPARKPPKESVNLILSVEKLFGISETFQKCIDPDLVLKSIGGTTRGAIERSYDWLIPVISSIPSIISRLPASASCFLLLRAYGTEGERNTELRELAAPLLNHARNTVAGTYGEDDARRAANLLMADVSDKNAERRECAHRVLQQAFSEQNKEIQDRTFDKANCTWLFGLLRVNHAPALIADAIEHIIRALVYERGRTLRALVFSLKRYTEFAVERKVKGDWSFSASLCNLISQRHTVWTETMDKFVDLRDLAMSVIYDDFKHFLAKGELHEKWKSTEILVRILPCQPSSEEEEEEDQEEILLPLPLLQSTCVLLSVWKTLKSEESDKSKALVEELVDNLMLPADDAGIEDMEIDGVVGIASASIDGTEKRAVTVDQWVMLAKARSDFVAKRAALSAPARFLPRLLLCSGLPKSSLLTMIDRLGQLGESEMQEDDRVFRDLLLPSSTADWGFGHLGSRRDIARKLIGRLSAYISLYGESVESLSANVSLTFLNWLSDECQPADSSKKAKAKKARKTGESFKLSTAQSILKNFNLDNSASEGEEETYDSDNVGVAHFGGSRKRKRKTLSNLFAQNDDVSKVINECTSTGEIRLMESWIHSKYFQATPPPTEKRKRQSRKIEKKKSSESSGKMVLANTLLGQDELNSEWKRARSTWVPFVTDTEGSQTLWKELFSKDTSGDESDTLLQECTMNWCASHVERCKSWIYSLGKEDLAELNVANIAEFLLVTSRQPQSHERSFGKYSSQNEGWMTTKESVDDVAKVIAACIRECTRVPKPRNSMPSWLRLSLLVAQSGKNQANYLIKSLLSTAESEGLNETGRMSIAMGLLRLYSSYPFFINLGNAKLRSLLVDASNNIDWRCWRTPIDEHIVDMLESLSKSGYCQRIVQGLIDLAKNHPLILMRKMNVMTEIINEDAYGANQPKTPGRIRVYGENYEGHALAIFKGSTVKVNVRHWGYSFNDPLWVSFLEILLSIHREVLFSCGINMGLNELLEKYVLILHVQSQLKNRDKAVRLRNRFADLIKLYEKDGHWNEWLSLELDQLGQVRNILVSCNLLTTDQAMASIKASKEKL